ncbi:hypothetical protein AHAT_34310 [Agarivorans sp. Toyoura001]|uniref:putative bifunctional diguanylate cyclase/phosphodiesterase n=1 Tax=Agarivorans sp. Toyoura001 TaxID=2283141 RepID=UPI0010E63260|nr:EAL domain-containing protein [Agarivorans sp. Toyoura001]GDY27541.1 hypothetical protein AHAT_34310 [Agarivorans sp. Toyoura001]
MDRQTSKLNLKVLAELIFALVAILTLGFMLARFEAFESIYNFSRAHESWELDELIIMLLLSPVFLVWVLARRWIEALQEAKLRDKRERQLAYQATHDPLTKLPNRLLLEDRLSLAVARAQRNHTQIAVMMLDLDDFKRVNDELGHDVGDRLLEQLVAQLKACVRAEDTIARFGGDEFVVVLCSATEQQACLTLVDRILENCVKPITLNGIELITSASVGLTFYPDNHHEELAPEQLIRQADQALYQAKLAGKNCYSIFNSESAKAIKCSYAKRKAFAYALNNQQLQLFYQPQVNIKTGQVIGAEALLRWLHPSKGLLSPMSFLDAIEEHSLSIDLGEWVIDTALAQLQRWQLTNCRFKLSINIGALHIQQSNFAERLQQRLAKYPRVNPNCLQLEITETGILDDLQKVAETITQCQKMGVSFALDDFGTGFSSLTYLQSLPAELIKIDRSFVRDELNDPKDLRMIQGIISLAKVFSLPVIAEGVESEAQQNKLLSLGCELAQGYLYAKALPADEFLLWLTEWQAQEGRQCSSPAVEYSSTPKLAL